METYVGRGAGSHIEKQLFSAKEYALICSPWITAEYADRIIEMVESGVSCRVITSDKTAGSSSESLEMFQEFIKPKKNYLGRVKKDWVSPPFEYKIIEERFVHAKIYTCDGKYAVTGSANLTESGLWHNAEHIIIMDNHIDVEKIEEDFEHLWNFYLEKEIIDESKGVLKGIWNRIKKIRETEN